MRVAIDVRYSGTSTGRYIDKLVEHLHRLKPEFEVVLLTKPHRVEFLKNLVPNFKVVEASQKEFTFGEQLSFKKQIKKLKADLVHFAMVQQPVFYHGKVVTTMNDLTTVRFGNPSKNPVVFFLKQQVYKWVNKKAARKSAEIITYSEYVKGDVAAFTHVDRRKITVIPLAAEKILEPAEELLRLKNKPFIMYVGRPFPHKNLERLVKAFALVKQQRPNLRLVLAGKTDANIEALQQWVEKQKISNVIFTDFVTDGELRWLYEHTLVYVFPSLSEGFGLPGLEAMAESCPVVSSNATCLPEVYKDGVLYFDPLNVEDMAEKIAQVVDDRKLAGQLVVRGSLVVKNYSWQKTAEQTLEVYRRVLG
jgi:glycosyltransferase involved in cell wall biosynthesis